MMKKLLLVICTLIFTGNAWAQPSVIFDPSKPEFFHSASGRKFTVINIPLLSTWTHRKPNIAETKILDANEQEVVEFSLKENGRKLIFEELRPLKNDYQNDYDRGTVEFNTKKDVNMFGRTVFEASNYAFHKVVIPDNTTIQGVNFSQKEPHTQAITGNNLTFIECNLVNVQIDPTWIVQSSNTAQIKRIKKSETVLADGIKEIKISHQVETNGVFIEVAEDAVETQDVDSYNMLMLRLNQ